MEKKMNNKGFSLVELIVVIAIMAVLVGVLAPQFIKYFEKSRESTDITNLDSIKQVVESYFADKELDDLPDTVKICDNSGVYDLTITARSGATLPTDLNETVLEQGGVKDCKIKGGQWTKKPEVTWDIDANEWTYDCASPYYKVSATGANNSIIPE